MTMKILSVLMVGLMSATCLHHQTKSKQALAQAEPASLYKINKIDSINNVYIIYTRKEGKIIRIASPKEQSTICRNLMENKTYKLTLTELFPTKIGGVDISPGASSYVTQYNVFGINFRLEPGENIYRAQNLKGLCIE